MSATTQTAAGLDNATTTGSVMRPTSTPIQPHSAAAIITGSTSTTLQTDIMSVKALAHFGSFSLPPSSDTQFYSTFEVTPAEVPPSASTPPPATTSEVQSGGGLPSQALTAAIAAPILGVFVAAFLILWWCYRRRQQSKSSQISVSRNIPWLWPHFHFREPEVEIDGTSRNELEAQQIRQELATDGGGGHRGNATALERLVRRFLGTTVEAPELRTNELETTEKPQELEA